MDQELFSIVCLVLNLLIVILSCVNLWKIEKGIRKDQKTLNRRQEEAKKNKI